MDHPATEGFPESLPRRTLLLHGPFHSLIVIIQYISIRYRYYFSQLYIINVWSTGCSSRPQFRRP